MAYRDRGRGESAAGVNLTPLLDVVLQLITFFMMLIHFGARIEGETAAIRLPTAPAALPGGDLGLDRIVVGVDEAGRLLAEGAALDAATSAPWWAEQARRRRSGLASIGRGVGRGEELPTEVVVRADRATTYGSVRGLLAAAQRSGFARFSLVVLRGADR